MNPVHELAPTRLRSTAHSLWSRLHRLLQPGTIVKQIVMWVVCLVTLFPVYFMLASALKTREQFISSPMGLPPLSVANFVQALVGKPLGRWFLNSVIVTSLSIAVVTVLATLAAFGFARMQFRGRDFLFNTIVPLMVIPPVVMIIPLFSAMVTVHLINTYGSVTIIYAGLQLPFTVYLLRNFMIKVPLEITDAALIDGCGQFQTLVQVMLPLSMPALVTSIVVNMLWIWNELLISLVFLQGEEMRTLMVGITVFRERFTLNVPVVMAGLTLATVPMLLAYLLGQRYFTRGLVAGAVK